MIRFPATDSENRIGSMFINPGGPGGSGLNFMLGAPPVAFALFPRFDVVSWDPRGVGASTPAVDCSTDEEDTASAFGYFTRPGEVDRDEAIAAATAAAEICYERNPEILPHLSTANVARDLDLMRAAVGDRQLTYLGISHGAHIGATYATLFPGRVRALLMDSPTDPNVWVNHPIESGREQLTGFEDALDRFFTARAVQQEECGFGGDDPEVAFDALVAEMNANPVPAPNSTFHEPVTGDEVLVVALESMYSPFNWDTLATALTDAANGDASLMRDLLSAYSGRNDDGTWSPSGVYTFTRYQDVAFTDNYAPYFAEGMHAYVYSPHFFGYAFDESALIFNPELSPVPKNDAFRGPWSHPSWATPALVFAGTHDPATPYRWGERYVHELGNAQLVTWESDGHGAITSLDPCVTDIALAYLEDQVLPAAGATCEQQLDPFYADSYADSQRSPHDDLAADDLAAQRWSAPMLTPLPGLTRR